MTDVLVERHDRVLLLTLNRPERLNALTVDAVNELGARLEDAGNDAGVGAVVVTGAGDAFSSGGDLAFLRELHTMPAATVRETIYGSFQRPTRAMRSMGKPVIAAVNGAAVGAGCEIAIAADFRIASERARFGEVWIRLGCVPALGGMFLLPRIIGLARATELVLTGDIIDAAEALRIGLVRSVVAPDRLRAEAVELASRLARGPAHAIAVAKTALNRGLSADLWSELDRTLEAQIGCFATEDFAEGIRALSERRPPRFAGS